jgi:outer membrane protein assembly factor BamB
MEFFDLLTSPDNGLQNLAVIPVLVGPLQALIGLLPVILAALGGMFAAMFKPTMIKRLLLLLWAQKFIVLGIVVVVGGAIYGAKQLWPSQATGDAGGAVAGQGGWSMYRGTLDRRGYVPGVEELGADGKPVMKDGKPVFKDVEDPAHGSVNWSVKEDNLNFFSSPVVIGNRVYLTSARLVPFHDEGGITCLNADTGALVWSYKGSGYRATFSSPAISGKYLVVGEGLHQTMDSRIFCLDLEQSEKKREGVKLWEYRTTSHMESSPCIDGDRMYFGGGDDGVYCFALAPDKDGKAQLLWRRPAKEYPDCESAPMAYDKKLYFGLGREEHAVCCADPQDGHLLWKVETPYATASPAIAGGRLYVGMGVGDFVYSAGELRNQKVKELKEQNKTDAEIEAATRDIKAVGEMWCIDLATHAVLWKYNVADTILGTPAVDGNRLYFGSRDGFLYCVSTDGKLIQKYDAHMPITCCPAVGRENVYFVASTKTAARLLVLNKKDLSLVWEFSLNTPAFSSPTVARGHVYLGTGFPGVGTDGFLCLGQPGRDQQKPIWPGYLGGPGQSGWLDGSMLPARGLFAWNYPAAAKNEAGGDDEVVDSAIHAPAAYCDGAVYVGLNQKDKNGLTKLDCLRTKKGQAGKEDEKYVDMDQTPKFAWFAPAKNPVSVSAGAVKDGVFFVDGKAGDAGRALHRLDPGTGKDLAQYPVASDASGEFVLTLDRIFIADSAKGLTCLDVGSPVAGRELWKANVGRCVGAPVLQSDVVLVSVESPPSIKAIDLCTGGVRWEKSLASTPLTAPLVPGNGSADSLRRVWVGQADGIEIFNVPSGREVTRESLTELPPVACGPVVAPLVSTDNWVACVTKAGDMVIMDVETVKEVARLPKARGALLYYTDDAINRYDLRTKKAAQWLALKASWPGTVVAPMIMVDSHLLLATDKEGFVCLKPRTK